MRRKLSQPRARFRRITTKGTKETRSSQRESDHKNTSLLEELSGGLCALRASFASFAVHTFRARFYPLSLLVLVSFLPQIASAQLGYRSIFGIQKSTLDPGNLYFNFTGDMVSHLKIYDQTKNTYVVKPSTMVYNDVALNSFVAYGLTHNLTVFGKIPLRSVHVYSLNPTLTGKGFGDLQLGGTLNFLTTGGPSSLDATLSTTLPIGADTPPGKGEYALGVNAIQFTGSVDGYNPIGTYGLLYSAYYNFVGNDGSLNYGDWTGAYLLVDKYTATPFGNFTVDAGLNAAYKFDDRISGNPVDNSYDYYLNVLAGITYYYSHGLDFRVGVPYTIYQKSAWFTGYSVLLGVEYQLGL